MVPLLLELSVVASATVDGSDITVDSAHSSGVDMTITGTYVCTSGYPYFTAHAQQGKAEAANLPDQQSFPPCNGTTQNYSLNLYGGNQNPGGQQWRFHRGPATVQVWLYDYDNSAMVEKEVFVDR
jgi:hypothetical protein